MSDIEEKVRNGKDTSYKSRRSKGLPKRDVNATTIKLEDLIPFSQNPFKQYEGHRFEEMIESVRDNGVIEPIVVRHHPEQEGKYEILSGHNRVAASKEAGLELIPAIIREVLSEEEALFIVMETNLIQRSFANLKHSERAVVIFTLYEAMKKKSGYRSDLHGETEDGTSAPEGRRSETREKLGEKYGLGKTTVSRYLRLNELIPALITRLDDKKISMRIAEALSYLVSDDQEIVENLIARDNKFSIEQANELKSEAKKGKSKSEKRKLDKEYIERVFQPGHYSAKIKPVNLSGQFLSQHFKSEESADDIEKVIAEALAQYFSNQQ